MKKILAIAFVMAVLVSSSHALWIEHKVTTNQLSALPILVYTDKSQYESPDFTNQYVRFQIWIREVFPFDTNLTSNLVIKRADLGKVFDGDLKIKDRSRQGIPLLDFMIGVTSLEKSYLSLITSRYSGTHEYQINLKMLYEQNKTFPGSAYTVSEDPKDETDSRFLGFMKKVFEFKKLSPILDDRLLLDKEGISR